MNTEYKYLKLLIQQYEYGNPMTPFSEVERNLFNSYRLNRITKKQHDRLQDIWFNHLEMIRNQKFK